MINSAIKTFNPVEFPTWTGLKTYMTPIRKDVALPVHLQGYQQTVNQMLLNVDTDEEMYLMIDEKFVPAGQYHRRPGLHVDGFWHPSISAHGGGHGGGSGGGSHGGGHRGITADGRWKGEPDVPDSRWKGYGATEGLLLASNTGDAQAYIGEFDRDFVKDWRGGDCSDIDVSALMPVYLEPNVVHAANVFTLHESLPVKRDCFRALVRINVPNWVN